MEYCAAGGWEFAGWDAVIRGGGRESTRCRARIIAHRKLLRWFVNSPAAPVYGSTSMVCRYDFCHRSGLLRSLHQ
jgi:hypothetical protein